MQYKEVTRCTFRMLPIIPTHSHTHMYIYIYILIESCCMHKPQPGNLFVDSQSVCFAGFCRTPLAPLAPLLKLSPRSRRKSLLSGYTYTCDRRTSISSIHSWRLLYLTVRLAKLLELAPRTPGWDCARSKGWRNSSKPSSRHACVLDCNSVGHIPCDGCVPAPLYGETYLRGFRAASGRGR